ESYGALGVERVYRSNFPAHTKLSASSSLSTSEHRAHVTVYTQEQPWARSRLGSSLEDRSNGHVTRTEKEPPARGAAGRRVGALAAAARASRYAAWPGAVRIGRQDESRVLSDHRDRLALVRDGGWGLGGDR